MDTASPPVLQCSSRDLDDPEDQRDFGNLGQNVFLVAVMFSSLAIIFFRFEVADI